MVLLACALLAVAAWAQDDDTPLDRMQVTPSEKFVALSWRDAEDTLHGVVQPNPLTQGQEVTVTLGLEPLNGPPYDIPLMITLRRAGQQKGETHVVKKGKNGWIARFTPEGDGPYWLDVGFRTTHPKLVHAELRVQARGVPLWAWGALALLALGIVAAYRQGRRQEVRPPAEAPQ